MNPRIITFAIVASMLTAGFIVVADARPRQSCPGGNCARPTIRSFQTVQAPCVNGVCPAPQFPTVAPQVEQSPATLKDGTQITIEGFKARPVAGVAKGAAKVAAAPVRVAGKAVKGVKKVAGGALRIVGKVLPGRKGCR